MKDKRILVTGGTGVLGSYIVEALLAQGFTDIEIFSRSGPDRRLSFVNDPRITFTRGNIVELYPLAEAIERAAYIIHAAALVTFSPARFEHMHAINVEGTANVVNLALEHDIHKLVHVSSIAAIGRAEKAGVVSENTKWGNSKYNSYYGITKYLSEQEVWRAYHEGLPAAIVNPSLVFGGNLWDQSSLKIFEKVYSGLPFYPTGSTGIVDARDVASLVLHLLQSDIVGERYIASGGNISYQNIFKKMAIAMDRPAPARPAPAWIMSAFWRIEKIKTLITGKEPIVTRETVKSTSHPSSYDNSKSLALNWGGYRDIDDTITEYAEAYRNYREGKQKS